MSRRNHWGVRGWPVLLISHANSKVDAIMEEARIYKDIQLRIIHIIHSNGIIRGGCERDI